MTMKIDTRITRLVKNQMFKLIVSCDILNKSKYCINIKGIKTLREEYGRQLFNAYSFIHNLAPKDKEAGTHGRAFRSLIKKCMTDTFSGVIRSLDHYTDYFTERKIWIISQLCSGLFDDTKLCMNAMTLTNKKDLMKVLELI